MSNNTSTPTSSNWRESVAKLERTLEDLKAGKQPLISPQLTLEAFLGYLDSDLCKSTEGSYDAYSRRFAWVFDNGYILTVGTGINPTISHLEQEFNENSPMPFGENVIPENWNFDPYANGWERKEALTSEDLIDFLANLAIEAGDQPTFIIPLLWKLDDIESYEDLIDDDYPDYETFYKLGSILNDEESLNLIAGIFGWGIEITDEGEYMPYYCQAEKFNRFTTFLENTNKWIVVIDEHCAACSRGSTDEIISHNPELKDAPVFMTWGQNSDWSHKPNGTFWAEVYINDEAKDEKFIRDNARAFGLDVDAWAGEEEFSGSVIFGENYSINE
jgi:hypothetical protein